MDKFLALVEDLLETDRKLTADMEYTRTGEWDSLTIISFLAMINIEYNKTLRVADFKAAKTFSDLYEIVDKAAEDE